MVGVWCLGAHYLVPSTAQSLKSVTPFFCPASLKWIVMNHNLESKRSLPELGLETLDQWASYVSTLCQPLGEGKVTPNQPTHLGPFTHNSIETHQRRVRLRAHG